MIKFDKVGHIIKNFFSLIFKIKNFYKTEIENLPKQNGNTFTSYKFKDKLREFQNCELFSDFTKLLCCNSRKYNNV
jgi:hypothetical protein